MFSTTQTRWRLRQFTCMFVASFLAALTLAQRASSSDVLSSQGQLLLKSSVGSGRLDDLSSPDFTTLQPYVLNFYEQNGWFLTWTEHRVPSAQADALIVQFAQSDRKGLNPADYDAARWPERLQRLPRGSESERVRFDLALTVSAMRLVSDLHNGRVNPRQVASRLNPESSTFDPAVVVTSLAQAQDVASVIALTEPPFAAYRRTEAALANYLVLAAADDGETLPVPRKPVEARSLYPGAPRLRRLLKLLGDLPSDASAPADERMYDDALGQAVRAFQRRHGLTPDGRLDSATVAELNVPISWRVRQLQLALERWRWVPKQFAHPPVVVNIPEFRLRALDENFKVSLSMNVIVGRAYHSRTPVFAGEMEYLIFRPYWNVPVNIARNELVSAIAKDSRYLETHNFEITTRSGVVVTRTTVDSATLQQLRRGELFIRQRPGPNNSLGLVKFVLPNDYDVYLHGTPAQTLFSRVRRDFSHGCIRVEHPEAFAAWALSDVRGWDLDRVEAAMQSGPDNRRVALAHSIPVLIVYGTAIVEETGEAHFYRDVYGYDARLDRLLAKGSPYPR
jgi:murein L,D-transpeptidase YcbB/YkuD